jgi:uncharacterized protein (DUF427 family)
LPCRIRGSYLFDPVTVPAADIFAHEGDPKNMVKAIWNNVVIAESDQTEMVEGNHYFPPESLHKEFFRDSATKSVCPWKGTAHYYTLLIDGKENHDAAWYYPTPKPAASQIAGRVAFWKGVKVAP